jgi:hypothetical protein
MGYTLTELKQEIADYKAELPVLEQAREIMQANYRNTDQIDWTIREHKAGLDYAEKMLEAVNA